MNVSARALVVSVHSAERTGHLLVTLRYWLRLPLPSRQVGLSVANRVWGGDGLVVGWWEGDAVPQHNRADRERVRVGGGGGGAGAGVGVGGVGWVIVVPKAGDGGLDTDESTRSARLGASSTRGTPSGGRPSRSSTVLGMDTCEFQRVSIPGVTGPPNTAAAPAARRRVGRHRGCVRRSG